jgi:hypothetical protein
MGSVTGVSLGGFATKEIAYVLRQDEQMANRFELLTLPRWKFEDLEYAKLLATFERQLPLWQASGLTDPDLAQHILVMAVGLIGGVVAPLRQAAVEAIRTGHQRIDRSMLARVNGASPERIEAVVHALDLQGCHRAICPERPRDGWSGPPRLGCQRRTVTRERWSWLSCGRSRMAAPIPSPNCATVRGAGWEHVRWQPCRRGAGGFRREAGLSVIYQRYMI